MYKKKVFLIVEERCRSRNNIIKCYKDSILELVSLYEDDKQHGNIASINKCLFSESISLMAQNAAFRAAYKLYTKQA